MITSSTSDKFILRLPDGMRRSIKDRAEENGRSMNSEILARLERSFAAEEEALRREFEGWYLASGMAEEHNWNERGPGGEYAVNYTETAWRAWKAARGAA